MSTITASNSKATTLARMQALITGLQKHSPNGQFTLGGVPFTTASLVQLFTSLADAITAVTGAQASAKDVVAAMRALEAKVGPVFLAIKSDLLNTYGTSTSTLADFGLEPTKARTPRTTEQKAASAAKAKATREARKPAPSPTAQPAATAPNAPSTGTSTK